MRTKEDGENSTTDGLKGGGGGGYDLRIDLF